MLVAERSVLLLWKKVKEWFWSCISLLIYACFWSLHVTFPYKEILFFFDHCHVPFPYMEPLSFFGRFAQKVLLSCFSDSFVQKTTQQSDGSCNDTSDSQLLYKIFEKRASFFLQTPMKSLLCKEYCNARHDDKIRFLPNCRYHIILIGNIKELLQQLEAFCFNYQ